MLPTNSENRLERIGQLMMVIGGIALLGIFATVLIVGHWPGFLAPIRSIFRAVSIVGPLSWVVEVILFVGPGYLVSHLGARIRERKS